jgi:hypothetical protein
MGRAVVPHVLVDHELVAPLEQVKERDRPVGSDDRDRRVELHHRQPAPGRGDGVALAGVRLLPGQKLGPGQLLLPSALEHGPEHEFRIGLVGLVRVQETPELADQFTGT